MRNRGFSLIELMIAITLGMLAVAAVGSVFIYGSRNYKQDDKVSRMQDELRFAMAQITQDIEMAGFYAQVRDLVNDIELDGSAVLSNYSTVPADDCGPPTTGSTGTASTNWVFRERRASIFTGGNATPAEASAVFRCITTSEFLTGTDILAIKRLGSATNTVTAGKAYLRTNGVETVLYVEDDDDEDSGPGPVGAVCDPNSAADDNTCIVTLYEFKPVVWYVRPYSVSATESPQIPALCRKVFVGGKMADDPGGCVASGVSDLQLEFGTDVPDSTGKYDGLADYFQEIGAPPAAGDPHPMSFVVSVRVHLLAQSTQRDVDYRNEKTYQLASTTQGPFNDGFYRRALSSTVLVRNTMNRLSPYSLPSY